MYWLQSRRGGKNLTDFIRFTLQSYRVGIVPRDNLGHANHQPSGEQSPDLQVCSFLWCKLGFPDGSDGKEAAGNTGDVGLIPGSGRYPGEGNGYPLQYSCLENSMNRGIWQATVHGVTKSQTQVVFSSESVLCIRWLKCSLHQLQLQCFQ